MASADVESKTEENIPVVSDQQTSTIQSTPTDNTSSFHEHSQSCDDPTHNHEFPSFIDQNDFFSSLKTATKPETSVKRKGRKNQKQGAIRSELIPGHRGEQNIDDLVDFINSPPSTNGKKQKKKLTTATTTN